MTAYNLPDTTELYSIKTLAQAKYHMLLGCIIGAIMAALLMVMLPSQYRIEMILTPAQKTGGGDFSALMPNADIPALRYFTQKLNALSSSDFLTFENMILSSRIAEVLEEQPDILNVIKGDKKDKWNQDDIRDYLKRHVDIYPVGATPLRRVIYFHQDPDSAKKLLTALYTATDHLIKGDAKAKSEQLLEALDDALRDTRNPDHRDALVALLKEQEHIKMLTSLDLPYAAEMLEPPVSSPKPVRPAPLILFPSLILAGLFLGYLSFFFTSKAHD